MYFYRMRTTINLDDVVYELASTYARARGITLGDAIGELIRKAQAPQSGKEPEIRTSPDGIPVLVSRGRTITPEMVREGQEDEIGA